MDKTLSTDLISREAAVREALFWYLKYKDFGDSQALRENTRARFNSYACVSAAKNVVCSLMELPAADLRLRAQWLPRVLPLAGGDAAPMCSACFRTSDAETAYCPWCGAKMGVDQDA